ncbi:MAG: SPOR domain-containing protein, partial [Leptolyngbyaceae cyanobacterium]
MTKQSSALNMLLSTTTLVLLCVGWGIFALMFFLLFSVPEPGQSHPEWYLVGITLLETGAFAMACLMCYRNWQSGQIVSGRGVWLWIGAGLLCYALGNVLFYLWGNVWGKDPVVSLGDFFYLISYVFLAWGMLQAVLPRRLNMEVKQWLIVGVVGTIGVVLALYLNGIGPFASDEPAEVVDAPVSTPVEAAAPEASTPLEASTPVDGVAPAVEAPEEEVVSSTAPGWVVTLDAMLEPFEESVTLIYVIGDCLLIEVATTMLAAFRGGRISQSWKLIAIDAF